MVRVNKRTWITEALGQKGQGMAIPETYFCNKWPWQHKVVLTCPKRWAENVQNRGVNATLLALRLASDTAGKEKKKKEESAIIKKSH
jgi:hypothetical protein